MISQEQHFGLSKYLSISEDTSLKFGRFRVWNVAATVSGLSLILPDYESLPMGGPLFYIINSGTRRILIQDSESNVISRIEINEAVMIGRSQ